MGVHEDKHKHLHGKQNAGQTKVVMLMMFNWDDELSKNMMTQTMSQHTDFLSGPSISSLLTPPLNVYSFGTVFIYF